MSHLLDDVVQRVKGGNGSGKRTIRLLLDVFILDCHLWVCIRACVLCFLFVVCLSMQPRGSAGSCNCVFLNMTPRVQMGVGDKALGQREWRCFG
jgi:hypothetical protein